MNHSSPSRFRLARLLMAFTLSAVTLPAAIVGVSVTNTSPADAATALPGNVKEFRTANTLGAVTTAGNTSSFSNHFQWMSAMLIPVGGFANINFAYPSFELTFTIDDPGNVGYTLSVESIVRGFVEAVFASGPVGPFSTVQSNGTSLAAYLNTGSGFALYNPLRIAGVTATASQGTPVASTLASGTNTVSLGSFVGTRTFGLRFAEDPSPALSQVAQNNVAGEAAGRFGLAPTLAQFVQADYPGVDGEAAALHGHFLTVSAEFNNATGVPEPATWVLTAGGLALAAGLRRRRR